MPIYAEFDRLEFKLLHLMYHQLNLYILTDRYPIDNVENYFTLAAYRCAFNHGAFDETKHKKGYLKKVLANLLPR